MIPELRERQHEEGDPEAIEPRDELPISGRPIGASNTLSVCKIHLCLSMSHDMPHIRNSDAIPRD